MFGCEHFFIFTGPIPPSKIWILSLFSMEADMDAAAASVDSDVEEPSDDDKVR